MLEATNKGLFEEIAKLDRMIQSPSAKVQYTGFFRKPAPFANYFAKRQPTTAGYYSGIDAYSPEKQDRFADAYSLSKNSLSSSQIQPEGGDDANFYSNYRILRCNTPPRIAIQKKAREFYGKQRCKTPILIQNDNLQNDLQTLAAHGAMNRSIGTHCSTPKANSELVTLNPGGSPVRRKTKPSLDQKEDKSGNREWAASHERGSTGRSEREGPRQLMPSPPSKSSQKRSVTVTSRAERTQSSSPFKETNVKVLNLIDQSFKEERRKPTPVNQLPNSYPQVITGGRSKTQEKGGKNRLAGYSVVYPKQMPRKESDFDFAKIQTFLNPIFYKKTLERYTELTVETLQSLETPTNKSKNITMPGSGKMDIPPLKLHRTKLRV